MGPARGATKVSSLRFLAGPGTPWPMIVTLDCRYDLLVDISELLLVVQVLYNRKVIVYDILYSLFPEK